MDTHTLRIPGRLMRRAQRLAGRLPGAHRDAAGRSRLPSAASVCRLALERGLALIEAEHAADAIERERLEGYCYQCLCPRGTRGCDCR